MIKYILFLSIGHLLGDFYFQKEKIYEKISRKMDRIYIEVFWHSITYYLACLLTILPIFSIAMVCAVTCEAFIHFIIESVNYVMSQKDIGKNYKVSVVHQCIHILSIFVLAYILNLGSFSIGHIKIVENILNEFGYNVESIDRWVLAILFIHVPANVFIQNFLGGYKPSGGENLIKWDNKAGRRIGTVERFVVC